MEKKVLKKSCVQWYQVFQTEKQKGKQKTKGKMKALCKKKGETTDHRVNNVLQRYDVYFFRIFLESYSNWVRMRVFITILAKYKHPTNILFSLEFTSSSVERPFGEYKVKMEVVIPSCISSIRRVTVQNLFHHCSYIHGR